MRIKYFTSEVLMYDFKSPDIKQIEYYYFFNGLICKFVIVTKIIDHLNHQINLIGHKRKFKDSLELIQIIPPNGVKYKELSLKYFHIFNKID